VTKEFSKVWTNKILNNSDTEVFNDHYVKEQKQNVAKVEKKMFCFKQNITISMWLEVLVSHISK
jgi:hypothetical protein